MNDIDNAVLHFFLRDSEAGRAVKQVLEEGCTVSKISEYLDEYARQVLAVFPNHLVHWDLIAERLVMDYIGAQQEGAPDSYVPEWDADRFDSNEC